MTKLLICPRVLLRGYMFYPLELFDKFRFKSEECPSFPAPLAPTHTRGWWTTQPADLVRGRTRALWCLLDKFEWISPVTASLGVPCSKPHGREAHKIGGNLEAEGSN